MTEQPLPENCPMRIQDYARLCPGTLLGPAPNVRTPQCEHQSECKRITNEFKKLQVITDSRYDEIVRHS